MKNWKLLTCVVAAGLAFYSCDSNDDENTENLTDDLTGTWELSRMAVPTAQDFDNDGDSNTDLTTEGSCYNSSWISFREDGTYEQHMSMTTAADGGTSLDCDMMVSSGTYTQSGNTVTTTRTSGEGSLNMTFNFDADDHTLTATEEDGSYTGWNNATSLFTALTGNLQLTFTKYTENEDDNGNGQDDDDNIDMTSMNEVVGNFGLNSFMVGNAQDLDNDGDSSMNLMTESNCYADSNITFNADGTYEREWSQSILSNLGTSLTCSTTTETGTWTRQGDRIITRHLSGDAMVATELLLDAESNTMQSEGDQQYPIYNSVTSLFAMVTGNVNMEYSKE
ncbi:hypothetical protein FLLO111716_13620 [Flavobacterium longum]|uniref:hypothetical protein n=1 Tax=Flavobacterium longum TaxID=1299340 RepID=UPI0039EAC1F6